MKIGKLEYFYERSNLKDISKYMLYEDCVNDDIVDIDKRMELANSKIQKGLDQFFSEYCSEFPKGELKDKFYEYILTYMDSLYMGYFELGMKAGGNIVLTLGLVDKD